MKRKKGSQISSVVVLAVLIALLAGPTTIAQEPDQGPIVVVSIKSSVILWKPLVEDGGFLLTISGPQGFYRQQEYQPGDRITFRPQDSTGKPLADGVYKYELRLLPATAPTEYAETQRGLVGTGQAQVQSGNFAILNGSFVIPEAASSDVDPGAILPNDVLHYDDVIITGSLCTGFDCANGESFGYNTIKLKENNLQIGFEDTSIGTFPTNDWKIQINDTTSGGASYFTIWDVDGGRRPFTIEAGAPAHALYVEDYGRVGLGTSIPYVELHIVDGDTPTVRLDQDGSSGWTAQRWDIAGNETNFFIRDVTNGSKLSFRIQPGAPSNSLTLKSNGRVGIGTWSPVGALEVKPGTDSLFAVLDNGRVGIGYAAPNHELTVNGDIALPRSKKLIFQETVGGNDRAYIASTNASPYNSLVFAVGTGAEAMRIASNGNVGIGTVSPSYLLHVNGTAGKPGGGSWSDSSDARLKESIHPIDGREALDLFNQLQGVTFEWVNPEEHSAGTRASLVAQEVEKVFPDWVEEYEAQGSDAGLIPEGEKAKAVHFPHDFNAYVIEAIKALDAENQALSETVEKQDATIAALQQQNADLEARLTALEKGAGTTNSRIYSLPLSGMFLGSLVVVGVIISRRRKQ